MELNGLIYKLSQEIKLLISTFLIVLSIGFYSGLLFVNILSGRLSDLLLHKALLVFRKLSKVL